MWVLKSLMGKGRSLGLMILHHQYLPHDKGQSGGAPLVLLAGLRPSLVGNINRVGGKNFLWYIGSQVAIRCAALLSLIPIGILVSLGSAEHKPFLKCS